MRAVSAFNVAMSAVAAAAVSANAFGQQAPPPAEPPPPAAAAPAAATMGESDHDAVVGRLGVGYMGRRSVGMGTAGVGPLTAVQAPLIGVRYWLNPQMGLDVGLGFTFTSGSSSTEVNGVSQGDVDQEAPVAFILHGGLPIALASADHYSFQITPELNIGYANQSYEDPTVDRSASGVQLDLGARAGAEIHFGFMGIPQLSLQGSVGLRIDWSSVTSEETGLTDDPPTTTTLNWSGWGINTTVYDNPWNIFTSNVAALYYF